MRHRRNYTDPECPSRPSLGSPFDRSFPNVAIRKAIICCFLLALWSATLLVARADDHIRAVRLSNVVGSVQILSGGQTQFSQAYPNMPLMEGSTLKTGDDGRAEIQFEDGSVVRVTPNSSVATSVLSRGTDGQLNTEVDLLTGLSYVEIQTADKQRFVVHFNNNEVTAAAQKVKFRVNLDSNPVECAVLDGTVHLSSGSVYSVDVRANETLRFDAADTSRYFLAEGVDGDSWDQWNADRDHTMGQMAAMETREALGSANPSNPGWSDLDYYGNWYSSPAGSVWSPAGAGAGWDPYGAGYWGYYGNTGGYVWISGYPWGWLPYQCGAWNYYNSFGWGWSPIGCTYPFFPGYGYGNLGNVPPRYRRLPHPAPVHLSSAPRERLIAVDRGPEATKIEPVPVTPRVVQLNGQPAHLLPKTVNPTSVLALKSGSAADRGAAPVTSRPGSEFGGQSGAGERSVSNVTVFRPSYPVSGARVEAPSYSFRPSAPTSGAGQAGGSMPSYGGTSTTSHVSAPSSGPAPSAGGGHVK